MKKPPSQDDSTIGKITITELAKLAGVSKATIYNYQKFGLLPAPLKLGLNLSGYDHTHLSRLKQISSLKNEKRLSLSKIKRALEQNKYGSSPSYQEEAEALISNIEAEKREVRAQKNEENRLEIIDAAIRLFSQNGYEKTTIESIADLLHVAKSTIYLYFESKEELFAECIERLTFVAVPKESWDDIKQEKDPLTRLIKRGTAFQLAFPNYKGILTMAKAALGRDNEKISQKARDTLILMTRPIISDLRRGIASGKFRNVDEELTAHLILAMGEGLAYLMMIKPQYEYRPAIDTMFDLLKYGIQKDADLVIEQPVGGSSISRITDTNGTTTQVSNIKFNASHRLEVMLGQAKVRIDLAKIASLTCLKGEANFLLEIKGWDGNPQLAVVDGSTQVSGDIPIGEFAIALQDVANIVFEKPV
jgi:AcrR family transcriptional regulator